MRSKLWLLILPWVFLFTFCYWVTELGVEGKLTSPFLRESVFPALSRARNMLTDLKFKSRGPRPPKNKIVVVEIDNAALETLGRWPWHRDVTAYLIEKTFQAGAKVVGLDMFFSEVDQRVPDELAKFLKDKKLDKNIQQFETDRQLEDVIRRFSDRLALSWTSGVFCQPFYEKPEFCPVQDPNAVSQFPPEFEKFAFEVTEKWNTFNPGQTPLISFLQPVINIKAYNAVAKHAGYANALLDSDGYIRRTHLLAIANGKPYPSLPLEMARVGLNEDLQVTLDEQQKVEFLGFAKSKQSPDVTPLGVMEINFRGPGEVIPHLPALDVLSEKDEIEDPYYQRLTGKLKSEILKDAYVLIGLSALGVFDMRHFPFETNAPGVDGHANILDNLLSDDPLVPSTRSPGRIWIPVIMILGVLLLVFVLEKLDAVPALVLFLVIFTGIWYVDFKVLFNENQNWNTIFLYLETFTAVAVTLSAKYILEERSKKFIRGAFSKYVAPQVVDSILKDPTKLSLGGERREVTILFSDIRGFTSFSEKMDAKSLAAFLNDYLGIMSNLVFTHHGTLDKYIGDAVMAFWGAPLLQAEHAWNACSAAIEMQKALEKNHPRFRQEYGIDVRIGIGVNTGTVSVGNMGSEQNFEYTVIGDHVNLASRLEGLTKEYGVGILTTRFTFDAIEKSGAKSGKGDIPYRVLDFVKVKGKAVAVELIQILERDYSREGLSLFEEGRKLYSSQKWNEAIKKFEAANQILAVNGSSDGPCETYIERCQYFQNNPPEKDWDGSWTMTTK